jgi:hypothetical protein
MFSRPIKVRRSTSSREKKKKKERRGGVDERESGESVSESNKCLERGSFQVYNSTLLYY